MKDKNITFIIGHRGCGKSTLLSRLISYNSNSNLNSNSVLSGSSSDLDSNLDSDLDFNLSSVSDSKKKNNFRFYFLDLDKYIEEQERQSLLSLWKKKEEVTFRNLEKKHLKTILQNLKSKSNTSKAFIALGAGCDLKELPKESCVLWLQRESDKKGRIFLNHPRLNPNLSSLEEFKERFHERQKIYEAKATERLLIPEGLSKTSFNPHEKAFFHKKNPPFRRNPYLTSLSL